MKDWIERYELYGENLEMMPDNKGIKLDKASLLIRWGIELLKLDDYDQAMIKANEAISILEGEQSAYYADALALKATIFMFTDNYEDSLKYYNKALEINPDDKYLYESKEELIKLMK